MPTLCCPAVAVPEHTISIEETLDLACRLHPHHEHLPLVLRLINNTGVLKRHFVQPIEETLHHPGFEERNLIYVRQAKARVPAVVSQALNNAKLTANQIDMVIYVSCTGFMMPSLTAWMINSLGFRNNARQLPIAQLGCAAGGTAISHAHNYCLAYPDANVLIVACEFCSLCYQPDDIGIGNLLSDGLFGDAVSAAVVRGKGGVGMRLLANGSRLVLGTDDWICYAVKATGFHFQLDKRVPKTMEQLAPELRAVAAEYGWDATSLDFYVIHAGGPRILNDLSHFLDVEPSKFTHSRATLTEYGNIASVVVFDALRRQFVAGLPDGARGIIAGFGPGITAEIILGTWSNNASSDSEDSFNPKGDGMSTTHITINKQLTLGGDMKVNRLGYGAMHLTGYGMWGPPEDPKEAIRVLRRAVELGVNFIDTADCYGPGYNEQIIRDALHPYADDLVICTKGGLLRSGPKDWIHGEPGSPYIVPLGRPAYLRQQVELSLRNLGVNCIPLYQLHSIDPEVPLADQLGILVELQKQGKIRHIGLSGQPGVTITELTQASEIAKIVAIENLYNIADRADEGVLRYAEKNNVAFIPWFPLGHGALVGPDNVLASIAAQFDVTPSQLALAWLLHRSPATVLIPGTTSVKHIEENARAVDMRLSAADIDAIASAVDKANPPTWRPER